VETCVTVSQSRLRAIVAAMAASPARWRGLVRYEQAQRWYTRLEWDIDHEVWLLSWLPGQATGFHDHGGSSGAFTVAQGTLRERTAPGGRPQAGSARLTRGAVSSFGPRYVHDVSNTSRRPAVSIHAYSPPLTSMRRYLPTASGLVEVTTDPAGQW
jgi:predicted metal-dependent enzyme (double-stranded beta helix superfamily)